MSSALSPVDRLLHAAGLRPTVAERHQLRVRVLTIGPAEARALLAANIDNRPLRPGRVKFYARVMKQGDWLLTHQGIAFDRDGRGLDLQHRLHGIIQADTRVDMMVTEGLDPAVFQAIDQHERRTIADALRKDRKATEVARFMIAVRGGANSASPTLDEVREVVGIIEDLHQTLMRVCNTSAALFSAAPVRAAAIVLMAERPALSDLVAARYRDLVLRRTAQWVPAMHAFLRQVTLKRINANGLLSRMDMLARVLVALDPTRAEVTKIQIDSTAPAIDALRARVTKLTGEAVDDGEDDVDDLLRPAPTARSSAGHRQQHRLLPDAP